MVTHDDSDAVELEVRIAARPETVFSFFTDPDKMVLWKGIKAKLDPRPGGVYRVDMNGHDVASGQYMEIVPHSRMVISWGWEGDGSPIPPGSSTVEITLTPDGDGTILRLRHTGLTVEQRAEHRKGWEHYLIRLVMAGGGGNPGPDPWAADSSDSS